MSVQGNRCRESRAQQQQRERELESSGKYHGKECRLGMTVSPATRRLLPLAAVEPQPPLLMLCVCVCLSASGCLDIEKERSRDAARYLLICF